MTVWRDRSDIAAVPMVWVALHREQRWQKNRPVTVQLDSGVVRYANNTMTKCLFHFLPQVLSCFLYPNTTSKIQAVHTLHSLIDSHVGSLVVFFPPTSSHYADPISKVQDTTPVLIS